ncbi:MAG: TetR/AcrR family transcriptional regulator [Sphingomonadaceae bacterium]
MTNATTRADGRHARSKSSRAKIVAAMLDLVKNGDVAPSAAKVAHAANVGLRSVFRHFDDMDSLYQEMSEHIEAIVMPIMLLPMPAMPWRDCVRELTQRRLRVFETILPYRMSASIKRFQSPFLMQDYQRMLRFERSSLEAVLPPSLAADRPQVDMLNLPMSFQAWRLLRYDQGLGVDAARFVVLRLIDAVLTQIEHE